MTGIREQGTNTTYCYPDFFGRFNRGHRDNLTHLALTLQKCMAYTPIPDIRDDLQEFMADTADINIDTKDLFISGSFINNRKPHGRTKKALLVLMDRYRYTYICQPMPIRKCTRRPSRKCILRKNRYSYAEISEDNIIGTTTFKT
jgi:hypothetical protein